MHKETRRFDYADYSERCLNHEAIDTHLRGFVRYFSGCSKVIDVGCGEGMFLRHLRAAGIGCVGIENDRTILERLRADMHECVEGNAVTVWPQLEFSYDGVFCSHLIEHLQFENVVELVEGFSTRISHGGVVVMAFPNPESLEMQLFHFWRDPQHVRFYHADLMVAMLEHYGMRVTSVFTQGYWGTANPVNDISKKGGATQNCLRGIRRAGRRLKEVLGIADVEVEAEFMRQIRSKGRELVIIARKEEVPSPSPVN